MDRIRSRNHERIMLQFTLLLLLLRISESYNTVIRSNLPQLYIKEAQSPGDQPPKLDPQRVLPLLAPSPLMPFTNVGVPKISGKCPLNFTNIESIITTTAIDCWGSLAPYLANVVCCPQLDATINILIGQSSFSSGTLAINDTHAEYCLSDITQILEAQGSYNQLLEICSINPTNLTRASCPLVDVKEIENILNSSKVIESCKRYDPMKECRDKVCENAIKDVAVDMASKNYSIPKMIDDCKKLVLRWLASKLEPSDASKVLRGISSCKVNKVCPLVFPDMKNVSKECGNTMNNQATCCDALEHYITQLQDQSFITNLQAINCASSFATSLQKANASANVYNICHIKLKDFSLQDSGCLFPSLPFDVTYDQSSGIDFKCDLNDNVAAPWPPSYIDSPYQLPNISTELPALPKATSDHKISTQHTISNHKRYFGHGTVSYIVHRTEMKTFKDVMEGLKVIGAGTATIALVGAASGIEIFIDGQKNHDMHFRVLAKALCMFGGDHIHSGYCRHLWGNASGAVANRVALEACVQARNEGRNLATKGSEIIREAAKWSLKLAVVCEV
ncbi:hypothetical protein L1987_78481 [Smallanthus sonchifolius]|uniref:Uncharacterized protein n=1 Tax=Smallanthus sonchifolius TaxID=185202 RepID=A0ACB8ZDT8_9ASTR|nr:hypothetical protein L1987_78481 [Smallanthus sonchifolius]